MKVLVTGAFGNIGQSTLDELIKQGHQVRCFDLRTRANAKASRSYEARAEIQWGDLRDRKSLTEAVKGQDAVIHLAFVIPHLSATGIQSEDQPDLARAINVGGTRKLIDVIRAQKKAAKLLFASSLHVFGRTQDQEPPRRVSDPVNPVEHYAKHKVKCEQMVQSSGLDWAILRLGAALPIRLILDKGMFEVPLNNRIEFVHRRDVGRAFANALTSDEVWGKILLIGGGESCQFIYRDLMARILAEVGVGSFPERAFASIPYSTDWLDTTESQRLLQFQGRTLDHYLQELRKALSWRTSVVKLLKPLVRAWMLRLSPYYTA